MSVEYFYCIGGVFLVKLGVPVQRTMSVEYFYCTGGVFLVKLGVPVQRTMPVEYFYCTGVGGFNEIRGTYSKNHVCRVFLLHRSDVLFI